MIKNLIIGTAGHIDHGKTSLVKALTGVDTDRLPEEKKRGITIELGFAELSLAEDIHIGIVDVPGHEKFIKTMVAGVSGIDIVIFVIAADEGIMPQTREHLDICKLLGGKKGIIALTKIDMVDKEWIELVTEEIKEFVADSFLKNAPIISISSKTGEGIKKLKQELTTIARDTTPKKADGSFRLPVDRVFTIAGFGAVVTGSLLSGRVHVGDEAEILPSHLECRIRGIQSHLKKSDFADAGSRVALNLQGIDHYQIKRGDVVVPKSVYKTTSIVDVKIDYLPSAPFALKHRSTLRLHSATYEVPAKIILFDRDILDRGESAFAQLRLAYPVLLLNGDPFVLRTSSPSATVAGGIILDPSPPGRRRRTTEALELLQSFANADETEIVKKMVAEARLSGILHSDILLQSAISPKRLDSIISSLLSCGEIIQMTRDPKKYLSRDSFTNLCDIILATMNNFFLQNQLKEGISREELKTKIPDRSDIRFFTNILSHLEKKGAIAIDRDIVKLVGRKAASDKDDAELHNIFYQMLENNRNEPPFLSEICEKLNIKEKDALEHLSLLVSEGVAVKIKSDIFYSAEALNEIKEKLLSYFSEHDAITPSEFREITSLSRKFMIPILEYFDEQKITIRVGDKRVLRKGNR